MELISDVSTSSEDTSLVWPSEIELGKPDTNSTNGWTKEDSVVYRLHTGGSKQLESPMKVKPIVLGELSSFDTDSNDGVFSRSNLCSPDVADSTPPSSGFSDHEDCGFADEFGAVLFEELGVLCYADLDPENASVTTGNLAVDTDRAIVRSLPTTAAAAAAMGKHVQMKRMKLLLRKIDASQFAARNKSRSSCPVLISSGAEQRKVTPENKGLVEPSLTSEEETKSSDDAAALPRGQEMVREMDMSETFSLSLQEDTTEEEDTIGERTAFAGQEEGVGEDESVSQMSQDLDTAYHLKLSESIKTLQDAIGTLDARCSPSPVPSAEAPPTPSPTTTPSTTILATDEEQKTTKRRLLRDRKQRHRKYSQESEATMPVDQPAPDTSKTYDLLVPDGIQSPADVTAVRKKRRLTKSTSSSNKSSSKHKHSLKKSEEQTADSVKKSRTRGLSKSHKKRLRDHDAEQENLPEEEIDERPSSKRSPAADVDKRPLSRRSLDDVDQRPLSKTSTAKSSRSPGGTSKKRKKEKQKHKRKKHKKSHRRMLNQEELENMLGGELTKLKEQLKEVNNGADSVIENSEKLKNTIRKKIKEIKSQKTQKISSKSKSVSSSPNRVAKPSDSKSASDTDVAMTASTDLLPEATNGFVVASTDPPLEATGCDVSPTPPSQDTGKSRVKTIDLRDGHRVIIATEGVVSEESADGTTSRRSKAAIARTMTCARCRPTPNRILDRCIRLPAVPVATPESSDTESDDECHKQALLPSGRRLCSVLPRNQREPCTAKFQLSADACDLVGQLRQMQSVLKDLRVDWPFFSHILHFAMSIEEMLWWVSDVSVEHNKQLNFDYSRCDKHLCLPSYVLGALLVEVGIILRELKTKLASEVVPSGFKSAINTSYYVNKYVRLFIAHGFREPSEFLQHVNQVSEGARSVNEVCSLTGFSAAVNEVDKNITELSRRVRKQVHHEHVNQEVMRRRNVRSDFTIRHNAEEGREYQSGDPESSFAARFPHNETLKEKKVRGDGYVTKPADEPSTSTNNSSSTSTPCSTGLNVPSGEGTSMSSNFVNGRLSVPVEALKTFTNVDNLLASTSESRLQRHEAASRVPASCPAVSPRPVNIQTVPATVSHSQHVLCTLLPSSPGILSSSFSSPSTVMTGQSSTSVATNTAVSSSTPVSTTRVSLSPSSASSFSSVSTSTSTNQSQPILSSCNQQMQTALSTQQHTRSTASNLSGQVLKARSSFSANTTPLNSPKMTYVSPTSTLPIVGPRSVQQHHPHRPADLSLMSSVVLARQISPSDGSIPRTCLASPYPMYHQQQPMQNYPPYGSVPALLSPMSPPTSPVSPCVVGPPSSPMYPASGPPPHQVCQARPSIPRHPLPSQYSQSRPPMLLYPPMVPQDNRRLVSPQPGATNSPAGVCRMRRPSYFEPEFVSATRPVLLAKTTQRHLPGPRPSQESIRPSPPSVHPVYKVINEVETPIFHNTAGKVTVTPSPTLMSPSMTRFPNVVKIVNASSTTANKRSTSKPLSPLEALIAAGTVQQKGAVTPSTPRTVTSATTASTPPLSSHSPTVQQEAAMTSPSCSNVEKQVTPPTIVRADNTAHSTEVKQGKLVAESEKHPTTASTSAEKPTNVTSASPSCSMTEQHITDTTVVSTQSSSNAEKSTVVHNTAAANKSSSTAVKQTSTKASLCGPISSSQPPSITTEILSRMIKLIQNVDTAVLVKPTSTPTSPVATATSALQCKTAPLPVTAIDKETTTCKSTQSDENRTSTSIAATSPTYAVNSNSSNNSVSGSSSSTSVSPTISSLLSSSPKQSVDRATMTTTTSSSSPTAVKQLGDGASNATTSTSLKQSIDDTTVTLDSSLSTSGDSIPVTDSNSATTTSNSEETTVVSTQFTSTDAKTILSSFLKAKGVMSTDNSSHVPSADKDSSSSDSNGSKFTSSSQVVTSASTISSISTSVKTVTTLNSLSSATVTTPISSTGLSSLSSSMATSSSTATSSSSTPSILVSTNPPPLVIKEKILLTVDKVDDTISLIWTLPKQFLFAQNSIKHYEVCYSKSPFSSNSPSSSCEYNSNWTSLGSVVSLPLPMSVTLTKFDRQSSYLFVVKGSVILNNKTFVIFSTIKEVIVS